MPPRAENLALARLALTGVGMAAGASDVAVADLKLAVTEACTNAILHAYADRPDGELVIRYRAGAEWLEIEVEDDGVGFDPEDPGAREQNGGGQGMGLMIIRSLMDSLVIESDESGSRISFSRRAR
jgi:serine/threonine-protein kinase RsbW